MGKNPQNKKSTPKQNMLRHVSTQGSRFRAHWKRWAARAAVVAALSTIPSGHGYPTPTPFGIGVIHTGIENGRKAVRELDSFLQRTRFPVVLSESPGGTKELNAKSVLAFQKAIEVLQAWKKEKPRTAEEIDASARSLAKQIFSKIDTSKEDPGTDAFRIEWTSFLIRRGIVPRPIEEYTPEQARKMDQLFEKADSLNKKAFLETNVGRAFALVDQSQVVKEEYLRYRDAGIQEGFVRFRTEDVRSSPFVLVGQGHLKGLRSFLPVRDLTEGETDLQYRSARDGITSFSAKRLYVYRWVQKFQELSTTPEQKAIAAIALQRIETLTPEELDTFSSIDGKTREEMVKSMVIKLNQMSKMK